MKSRKANGFMRRAAAMLLALAMTLSGSVCAFADVDGGTLMGDPFSQTSDGETLISSGDDIPGVKPEDENSPSSVPSFDAEVKVDPEEEDVDENNTSSPAQDETVSPSDTSVGSFRNVNEFVAFLNSRPFEVTDERTGTSSFSSSVFGPRRAPARANEGGDELITGGQWSKTSVIDVPYYSFDAKPGYPCTGSALWLMEVDGHAAFCMEPWYLAGGNGQYVVTDNPRGNLPASANAKIDQYLANYDAEGSSIADGIATQVLIWEAATGNTTDFYKAFILAEGGTLPPSAERVAAYNKIKNGTHAGVGILFWLGSGDTVQMIVTQTFDTPKPGDDDDDDTPKPGDDDDDDEQEAVGQVTITKKDDEGRSLDGAIFKITAVFGNGDRKTLNSHFEVKDGSATLYYTHPKGDTKPAVLTITEVQAPPGYVLDPTPQTVTVSPTYVKEGEGGGGAGGGTGGGTGGAGGGGTLIVGDRPEVKFENKEAECTLIIYKYQKGDSSIALAGAQFLVEYVDKDVWGETWTVTTGEDGTATVTLPKAGTIQVTETEAPENYKIIETENRRSVTFSRGETKKLSIPNDKHGSLRIYKRDIDDGRLLAGATFEIRKIGGDGSALGETAGSVRTAVTGEDGTALIEGLEPGSYQVKEVNPPQYYSLSDDPIQTVEILDGSHETVEITFFNEAYTGLRIIKVDAQTGIGLPGAVFSVYRGDGIKDGAPTGDLVGNYTTSLNGSILIENLERGKYTVYEEQPPYGYVLDESRWRIVNVTDDNINDIIQVIFRNQPKPNLKIIKKDKETGKVLEGAVFRVGKQNGVEYNEYTTDKNGEIFIEKLDPDWYMITEMRAPSNYLLPEDPELDPVLLVPGKTTEVIVTNQVKPTLTLEKVDAITRLPLAMATFRLTKKGASEYTHVTTNDEGKAVIEGLDAGWYIVEEIKAPTGYLPITESFNVELKPDEDTVLTIPNTKIPSLTIKKVDALTRNPLKNAEFELRKSDGTLVFKGLTDSHGEIYIERIDAGVYRLKETGAPDGYEVITVEQDIIIEEGKDIVVTVENSAIEPLYIQKIDAKTGEPLDGAVFSVRKTSGEFVGEFTTGVSGFATITGLQSGYYEITEIKAPPGYSLPSNPVKTVEVKKGKPVTVIFEDNPLNGLYVSKIDADTGKAVPGVSFRVTTVSGDLVGDYVTDANGIFTIVDLETGAYIVTETEAAPGYILDDTPHVVNLKKGETTKLTIKNTPLTGMIILKKDAQTGDPLAGAIFTVGTIDGREIGRYETNSSGVANVPNLETGYYVVTEVKAPTGYAMSKNPSQTIRIENGRPVTVTFENEQLRGLQIIKVDEKTGEPLTGVTYKITKANGEFVGQYKTDKNGLIIIPNLDAGAYTILEIATIDGYILDNTPKTVTLEEGKTTVVTVELTNKPLAGLQIRKIDGATNDPLSGVEFEVTTASGDLVGRYTTSETGTIFIENLQPGAYIVTELTTKANYTIDAIPRTVTVKSGEMVTETFKNYEYPTLTIKKVDSETGQPLAGAKFKLMDANYRELGVITTSELGLVSIGKLEAGTYYVQETQAPSGYVLDSTVRQVSLQWGKTTVLEIKNTPRGSLRIQKVDSVTGKPLYDATFNLYDNKGNLLGEYTTNNAGMIIFPKQVTEGTYVLKETKAPDGYVLDKTPITFTVKAGETTELTIKNTPETGNIRIVKVAADYNDITKDKEGDTLAGAVFEIYNESGDVVDRITTGADGVAKSKNLPIGKYGIKEVTPPKYYTTDGKPFYAEIKVAGDLIKFKVENKPTEITTTVQKRGNVQVIPGDSMTWEFFALENKSTVALDEFYWHDLIPTDAVRATSFTTGVWSERVNMTAYYRTNLTSTYRVLKDNLLSTTNHELALTTSALGLKANEYVTDVKLVFGTVQPGFHETTRPTLTAYVLPNLLPGYSIVNRTDVGGRNNDEWVYSKDTWVTTTFGFIRGVLPKTGIGKELSDNK